MACLFSESFFKYVTNHISLHLGTGIPRYNRSLFPLIQLHTRLQLTSAFDPTGQTKGEPTTHITYQTERDPNTEIGQ
jgi:hypothetical protein